MDREALLLGSYPSETETSVMGVLARVQASQGVRQRGVEPDPQHPPLASRHMSAPICMVHTYHRHVNTPERESVQCSSGASLPPDTDAIEDCHVP